MRLQKMDCISLNFYSEISVPITARGALHGIHHCDCSETTTELLGKLSDIPWVLLELSTQYYYSRLLGENHPMCRMLFLSEFEWQQAKDVIALCFRKVTFCEVQTPLSSIPVWQIQVKGISAVGARAVEQLPRNNALNKLLHDLYLDEIAENIRESSGIYACKSEETQSNINFDCSFKHLFSNKFFRSIDVSNMSLSCLTKHVIINRIAATKENVWIVTDDFSNELHIKTLCWK